MILLSDQKMASISGGKELCEKSLREDVITVLTFISSLIKYTVTFLIPFATWSNFKNKELSGEEKLVKAIVGATDFNALKKELEEGKLC